MKSVLRRKASWLALALTVSLPACGGADDEPELPILEARTASPGVKWLLEGQEQALNNLGIDTKLGGPSDPSGKALPASYNPLARKKTAFRPKKEIFVGGLKRGDLSAPCAGKANCLYDDSTEQYRPLFAMNDDSWTSATHKNVIGADVDGDGLEEIVLVHYVASEKRLRMSVIDRDDAGYSERHNDIDEAFDATTPTTSPSLHHPTLAKGDLDGDGRDAIIVGFSNLYLVEITPTGIEVTRKAYPNCSEIYVAAGDVDGDGKDELAVTSHENGFAYIDLYDGSLAAPLLDHQLLHAPDVNNGHTYAHNVKVAIGDIDGDKLGEIVFNGARREYNAWNVTAMDDAQHGFKWLGLFFHASQGSGNQPTLVLLDYNGDGTTDIFASRWVLGYEAGSTFGSNSADVKGIQSVFSSAPSVIWAGDVDGAMDGKNGDFGKDELVYYYNGALWIGGLGASGKHEHKQIWSGAISNRPRGCVANVDADSPLVEYVGRELQFSDPQVIAVLAAPPIHEGLGQEEASSTSFGKSTANGVEKTQSMGFSVGFSVGYESSDPFGIYSASFKVTVESAMDWISSQSTEIEKYIAYTSGPDEDKVIFTAIPFDVYYYRVLAAPDASDVGKLLTVNVPREMQVLSVNRDFYNKHHGAGPEIDQRVLGHTIGDPSTYPGKSQRDTLTRNGGLYSMVSAVGVGSGAITVGVQQSETEGHGTSFDFGVTIETEVGAGGVTMGSSFGFHYGYEYSVSNTEATIFEGTVGDIPAESYSGERAYSFGLFSYPLSLDGQQFTVVNYWVE
jgi:hypothetical protein